MLCTTDFVRTLDESKHRRTSLRIESATRLRRSGQRPTAPTALPVHAAIAGAPLDQAVDRVVRMAIAALSQGPSATMI